MDDFLAPANPTFDLKKVQPAPKKAPKVLPLTFRETLIVQPPLGPNERLPTFLALKPGELALASSAQVDSAQVDSAQVGSAHPANTYTYVPEIQYWIPTRHELVLQLIFQELQDTTYSTAHGSPETVEQGCNGPLCRRQRRIDRQQATRLRQMRLTYRGVPVQTRARDYRTKTVPQYAAVDPLLLAFTILSHLARPPRSRQSQQRQGQLTREQKIYSTLNTRASLHGYLTSLYETVR
jgi:hypothetical protein